MIDNSDVYDDEIDLMEILAVLWRRKILIAIGTLIVMIASFIYVRLSPEIYQVEMTVKPAVLEIDSENNIIYATAPEKIKGRIESEIYGQKVLNGLAAKNLKGLPDKLMFKAEIPKDADFVTIVSRSSDTGFAIKIQEELGRILVLDDSAVLENKKAYFERRIRMYQSDLQENSNIEKSYLLNVNHIEKRIGQLTEDIARMKQNNVTLNDQRKQLLSMKPDGASSLSVLLYSNTIQQTLQLINEVKEQLGKQLEKKEEEIQKIISLRRERASISEEINHLKYKLGMMNDMEIVSPPVAGKSPVKPRKSLVIMLSFVAGLFFMIMTSFTVEYIDSYRKKEVV